MTPAIRIGSAVTFVQQLGRSVSFCRDVLGLAVTDESPTAALLTSPGGAQLILRAMGATAAHPLGGVGGPGSTAGDRPAAVRLVAAPGARHSGRH